MANKDFEFYQKNKVGTYDELIMSTKPTNIIVSGSVAQNLGITSGSNSNVAIKKVANLINQLGYVQIKVVDQQNRPVQGALIKGLSSDVYTNSDGTVVGEATSNNAITVVSPYVDLSDGSGILTSSITIYNPLIIRLQPIQNESIITYTESKVIKFSDNVDKIDICCVGGGGSGGDPGNYSAACGGGGGGIVNHMDYTIASDVEYSLIVGAGGTYPQGNGGTSSFGDIVSADGGTAGTPQTAGTAGIEGCGNGGNASNGESNTTISRFDDGSTFYSGGGGGGRGATSATATMYTGGAPNGANGALVVSKFGRIETTDAGIAEIGGGGGGGAKVNNDIADGSSGGSGAVFIRIHLK